MFSSDFALRFGIIGDNLKLKSNDPNKICITQIYNKDYLEAKTIQFLLYI